MKKSARIFVRGRAKVVLAFVLAFQLATPAFAIDSAPSTTEAQAPCLKCELPAVPNIAVPHEEDLDKIKNEIGSKTERTCDAKPLLIDPKAKSLLESMDLSYSGNDPAVIIGRSALTCVYGALAGGANSIKDLVMAVPNILGLGLSGLKAGASAVGNFDYSSWLKSFKSINLVDSVKGAYSVTKDTVAAAYQKSSEVIYNGYHEGGVTGSVAAVAQAAYRTSPHHVVGQFLAGITTEIARAVVNEWKGFTCLNPEEMSELICRVMGYLATDIMTGKLILSTLSKADKLKDAVRAARGYLEQQPLAGKWLTKDFEAISSKTCEAIKDAEWIVDAKLRLQNQSLEVVKRGDAIVARSLNPKSGQMGCFEMKGSSASGLSERLAATEQRQVTTAELSTDRDVFSPQSPAFARTNADFVAQTNKEAGLSISSKQATAVAKAMEAHPDGINQMQNYGEILKALAEAKRTIPLSDASSKPMKAILAKADDLIKELNRTQALGRDGFKLNSDIFRDALRSSIETKDPKSLLILNRALLEFNKSTKSATAGHALEKWESFLKEKRPQLTSEDIRQARECLFH